MTTELGPVDLHARYDFQSSDREHLITMRCPQCHHAGAFGRIANVRDIHLQRPIGTHEAGIRVCLRLCPRPECRAVFMVADRDGELAAFPAEALDFDGTDLPELVHDSLAEAVGCHAAGCYKAAAMMVRKTVESICDDRAAQGPNLMERIKDLRGKVILPDELFEAVDELRLLGNDATHVAARDFDEVGKAEVELAIDLTREILKAVYQYKGLLERLRALKIGASPEEPPPPSVPKVPPSMRPRPA